MALCSFSSIHSNISYPPPRPTTFPIDPALLYYYRFDVVDICNNNVNFIYNHAKSIYDASAPTLNISQTTKKFGTGSYYLQTLGTNLLTINGGFSGLTNTGLTNGSVSFAFWWYPTGSIQAGNNMFFFAGTSDGNPYNQIILFWSSTNPVTAGSIKLLANTYGATNVEITSTPFIALNQWYHIVFIVSRISSNNITPFLISNAHFIIIINLILIIFKNIFLLFIS